MSETEGKKPEESKLGNLITAAELTGKQKFLNFFGLGYGGNTAVAVIAVKTARKFFPGFVAKWESSHEEKFFKRKVEEQITPIADKLPPEARKAIEEKIRSEAKAYAKHTVNARLLATGGFAMLPFQSAMEVRDFGRNIKPVIKDFQDYHKGQGKDDAAIQALLVAEIEEQKVAATAAGKKKGLGILDNALEEPKFNPLGPDAAKGLPKWMVGRTLALGAAFTVQTVVDDRFKKPKDAIDHTLAKIITRIMNPKGYTASPDANSAFAHEHANTPKGIDPKVLDVVRMVTTDGYMTTVAIATQMASNNYWDNNSGRVSDSISKLRSKFSSSPAVAP